MGRRRERWAARVLNDAAFGALRGFARLVAALPARWVLKAADAVGTVLFALDSRGRRVGRENLRVVYGDALTRQEKRRLLLTSMRGGARAIAVVLHAAPLTERRFRAWVDVPEEVEATLQRAMKRERGAIIASAHVGSWEILLGMASVFPGAPPLRFLAEDTFHPVMDRFLAWIRGTGGSQSSRRSGGALALQTHLRKGGLVGLVIDRNVRRVSGGIWAPFFGLPARTTPLAGWLARKNDVPVAPIFCLPQPDGRYRIELAPEVTREVRTDDFDADVLEITTRLNRIVEDVIRRQPEAWMWLLKRYKSRPEEALGDHPPYSIHDP